ncbi:hypothetical protein BASA81_008752 [Batrachochytrium salamandrivorans]|nr:hypothetical protein BASA81_008752 [Batrachochytrium salamandrivorans]
MPGGHTSQVDLSTCCVEYYDSDNPSLPVLVVLGPAPGDIRDFDMVKPALERKFRVVILQYPGFVGSTFEEQGETGEGGALYLYQVVLEFLEIMKLPKAMFLGVCLGAFLACKLAIEFPHLVGKLCLVSPMGFTPPGLLAKHYITLMSGRFAPNTLTAAKSYIGHKEKPLVASMLERAALVQSTPTAVNVIRAVWRSFLLPETDLTDRAAAIKAPVLLVFGKNDPIVSPTKEGKVARKAFGEAAAGFIVLEARHVPYAEVPDDFVKAVMPFLGDDLDLL